MGEEGGHEHRRGVPLSHDPIGLQIANDRLKSEKEICRQFAKRLIILPNVQLDIGREAEQPS
jgi:hypothetical protein